MSSFIFASSNSLSEKDFAFLVTFDDNFGEWFEVVLANEKELEMLFSLLGVDRTQKMTLTDSEDFEKLYDHSQFSLPELNIKQFDSFYENWLEMTGRESDMDEYGQLIFIQGMQWSGIKMQKELCCKQSHNNTCQSDSLFRGSFGAGRYASTKNHSTNCRCTLRYV